MLNYWYLALEYPPKYSNSELLKRHNSSHETRQTVRQWWEGSNVRGRAPTGETAGAQIDIKNPRTISTRRKMGRQLLSTKKVFSLTINRDDWQRPQSLHEYSGISPDNVFRTNSYSTDNKVCLSLNFKSLIDSIWEGLLIQFPIKYTRKYL